MNYNLENMTEWELDKAMFLIKTAKSYGMDLSGYGELSVNPNSGYTYLWLEDYPFTIYMPITCDLTREDVWALYTCPYDGEEIEDSLSDFSNLDELYEWTEKLSEEKEN